jgi:release factor glutamine methyltransferase
MRTILEILNLSTSYLKENGVDHARRQAEELVSEALGISRIDLYLEHDRPLAEAELNRTRSWLKRRAKGEPLAYIVGSVQFFGCQIQVTPQVLIPRQETEILVDLVAKKLKECSKECSLEGKVLWDICCGSGCLGISLKKTFPDLKIVLSDLSHSALAVAKQNAHSNQQDVEFLQGDLLNPFEGRKADFIICNPPYVAEGEVEQLDREVRQFEPHLALIGGVTGVEFYERLANDLPHYLFPRAKVWLEIGHDQGNTIQKLFKGSYWKNSFVQNDWSGKERFFSLEIE